MRWQATVVLFAIMFVAPIAAQADDTHHTADTALLERVMGPRVLGFVRIDLAQVQADQLAIPMAAARMLLKNTPLGEPQQIVTVARSLHEAGPRYAYLLLASPAKIGFWPEVQGVVSVASDTEAEKVEQALQRSLPTADSSQLGCKRVPGGLVVGPAHLLPPGVEPGSVAGREIGPALAAAGDAPLVLALVPSADQRRVLQEVLPLSVPAEQRAALPPGFADVRWGVLALRADPAEALRIVTQHDSPERAAAAAKALQLAAALFAKELPQAKGIELLQPDVGNSQVTILADSERLKTLTGAMSGEIRRLAGVNDRRGAVQNLKQVGLALLNAAADLPDASRNGRFPDAAIRDPQGNPLLSWRVALLPYLDQNELYREFRLDEPWDSAHNKKLISRMPEVYRVGTPANRALGKTCILLPVRAETLFPAGQGVTFKEVTDGLSNTILAVEANDEHAVIWTRPDDLVVDLENPQSQLGGHFGPGFIALYADGSVQFIENQLDAKQLRALFTRAGGESLDSR